MASKEPTTKATSTSGVTTYTQPVDAGSNPKKRKIETQSSLFLVEVIDTTEPSEAVSRYLPMKKSDPFAILMYQRVQEFHGFIFKGGKKPMDYTLFGCDTSGNEGDSAEITANISREEEKLFRRAPSALPALRDRAVTSACTSPAN